MGKSVIPVRNDLTFLDLTVQQIEGLNKTFGADVPLVLMNSFNTDEDTQKIIRKYSGFDVRIVTFNQSRYPRIHKESLMPIARDIRTEEDIEAWYPPGHGDFYKSFYNSGVLEEFVKEGREYVFMSNIDNMGATVDLKILNLCLSEDHEFVMEVTDNPKSLDDGVNVIQLETAVGAAMKCFEKGIGINVPRSRFLPVKKSSDLLLIMSNLYSL